MITPAYLRVWMTAKNAARRLRHRVVTSEHLFYACLHLHSQRDWALSRDLPVTAQTVWSHLKLNPPSESYEDFCGVPLGVSAKLAFERAEIEAAGRRVIGTESLMRALLSEPAGPVRSLLDSHRTATSDPVKS